MTILENEPLKIIEAALFTAGEPLSIEKIQGLWLEFESQPTIIEIKDLLQQLSALYQDRGVELVEVASGYRFQAKQDYAPWLQRLFEKKPGRYSKALLETLALIVYRQPITRGEIEDVRGVAVSTQIIKTLMEREWIKVVGTRDLPGKPSLFGTTKQFLDDFNLKTLSELPSLRSITHLEQVASQLELDLAPALENSSEEAIMSGAVAAISTF